MLTVVDLSYDESGTFDLAKVISHTEAVAGSDTIEKVYQVFQRHPVEYMGVTEQGRLLGIISRSFLGSLLGSRFGFSIYARLEIKQHLLPQALVIEIGTPLMGVLERALTRQGETFYADVALVGMDGQYLGMIEVQTLVRLQSEVMNRNLSVGRVREIALQDKNQQLFRSVNELRQSQGRYQILFENHALGVALLNGRGDVETHNSQLAALLFGAEYNRDIPITNLLPFVSPPDRPRLLDLLQQHEEYPNGHSAHHAEFLFDLSGLGTRLFKVSTSWIRETGQICACLDDITEAREMATRVVQKEKSALVESLAGGIAHEINNKLLPIVGFSELLQMSIPSDSKLSAYCETIRKCAVESAQIIRQLLQLSKPALGEFVPCDLRVIVQEALAILQLRLRESQTILALVMPDKEIVVQGDPAQIKQVVLNLALNALDAMAGVRHPELRITVSGQFSQGQVVVSDNGQGIAPENIRRIFDPFFSTKHSDRGTGLGLSVSFSIVKQHGGEILVDSYVGIGTNMTLKLPLSHKPLNAAGSSENSTRFDKQEQRVLVVDDEEFITSLVAEVLRDGMGCTVERVASGEQAIERMQTSDFAMVISDVRMPGMNGLSLLDWVRRHRPRLASHFLLITGDAGTAELNNRIESLGIPVLRKPFTINALLKQCATLSAN